MAGDKNNGYSFNKNQSKESAEDIEKEHQDIVKEIEGQKNKGSETEVKDDKDVDNKEEEGADEQKDQKSEKSDEGDKDEDKSDKSDEGDESVEDGRKKSSRFVPLSKYQDTKTKAQARIDEIVAENTKLKADLEKATTTQQVKTRIKEFAEKFGRSEEETNAMVDILRDSVVDPSVKVKLDSIEVTTKKQQASQQFEDEFARVLKAFPQAADHKEELREKAYEDDNLKKPLFEIFVDDIQPLIKTPRKTGESSSKMTGVNRGSSTAFDPNKVAAEVQKGTPGAMKGLTGEQEDQVFNILDKTGSRYNRR